MRLLTLIRHAKAESWVDDSSDFYRSLSPRGQLDASRMGRHLRQEYAFDPDALISSPAIRAISTARLIAESTGFAPDKIEQQEQIYEAEVSVLAAVVRSFADTLGHAALVGHNPGFEGLANWLAGRIVVPELPTCGVVMLECHIKSWSEIKQSCASLRELVVVRDLPGES